MPSNTQRALAALATAGIFLAGAWIASDFRTDIEEATASSVGYSSKEGLVVQLHGARNAKGQLIVVAYDNAQAFDFLDEASAAGYIAIPAQTTPQRVDFPDLNRGYYALVAYHDQNSDYQLNMREDYIPTEGYAISGLNDLHENPVFDYSLIAPGKVVDLTLFYWPDV